MAWFQSSIQFPVPLQFSLFVPADPDCMVQPGTPGCWYCQNLVSGCHCRSSDRVHTGTDAKSFPRHDHRQISSQRRNRFCFCHFPDCIYLLSKTNFYSPYVSPVYAGSDWNGIQYLSCYTYKDNSDFQTFVNDTSEVLSWIRTNDTDFYRIEKDFRQRANDPMLLDYAGLSHFSSSETTQVLDFLEALGFPRTFAYSGYYNTTFDTMNCFWVFATCFPAIRSPNHTILSDRLVIFIFMKIHMHLLLE